MSNHHGHHHDHHAAEKEMWVNQSVGLLRVAIGAGSFPASTSLTVVKHKHHIEIHHVHENDVSKISLATHSKKIPQVEVLSGAVKFVDQAGLPVHLDAMDLIQKDINTAFANSYADAINSSSAQFNPFAGINLAAQFDNATANDLLAPNTTNKVKFCDFSVGWQWGLYSVAGTVAPSTGPADPAFRVGIGVYRK